MQPYQEYQRDGYTISTDPNRLNIPVIHQLLTQYSYWAQNRALEVVQKSVQHSLNFGLYCGDQQIGYARVVTDYATFAWLCDVIIHPDHRGQGLSKWLVECIINHPELKTIRRIMLATKDAHELYRKYGGFEPINNPERWMQRFDPHA